MGDLIKEGEEAPVHKHSTSSLNAQRGGLKTSGGVEVRFKRWKRQYTFRGGEKKKFLKTKESHEESARRLK